jgi:hypothetical protein
MSEADPAREGRFHPFAVYAASPRPTGPSARRVPQIAADNVPLTTALRAPDPWALQRLSGPDRWLLPRSSLRAVGSAGRACCRVPLALNFVTRGFLLTAGLLGAAVTSAPTLR